jgi:hypothetical protein
VEIVDNNTLNVGYQLFSLNALSDNEYFSKSSHDEVFEEMLVTQSSLYYKSFIEFRSIDGQQLFVKDDLGHVKFMPPIPPAIPEEGEPAPPASRVTSSPPDPYDLQLIADDGAKLNFDSGEPYLSLTLYDTATLNQFKEMELYLSSAATETNPFGSTFVI